MSDTIVDMPKVAQLLDAGWRVEFFKNAMSSYSCLAWHPDRNVRRRTASRLEAFWEKNAKVDFGYERDFDWDGDRVMTDDFTPEQALTRMAYKVFGEII